MLSFRLTLPILTFCECLDPPRSGYVCIRFSRHIHTTRQERRLPFPGARGHLFRGPSDPSRHWSHGQGRGAQCCLHLRRRATNDLSIDTLRPKSLIDCAVQRARNAVSLVKLQYYDLPASSCTSIPIGLSAPHSRPQSALARAPHWSRFLG